MENCIIWVGLDVHKLTIQACWARGSALEDEECQLANDEKSIRKLFKRLQKEGEVRACYEAGPCGYVVRRLLTKMGIHCDVIVPSMIPRKSGDRVKTDRRDARKLMRYYRMGELTVIRIPSEEEEGVRALLRCREDLLEDLHRQRQRLLKMLNLHGRRWEATAHWSQKHWAWLRTQKFDQESWQRTFDEYLQQVAQTCDRLSTMDDEVNQLAEKDSWKENVRLLCCLKGFKPLTAMTVLAEIQDFRRFESPRQLMSFLGMTPTLYSSASTRHQGAITKAGNAHARRVLIEAAWHYRHRPQLAGTLRQRCKGQSAAVLATATKAQHRLNTRFRRLIAKGKQPNVTVVAVARELAGFVWALMVEKKSKS